MMESLPIGTILLFVGLVAPSGFGFTDCAPLAAQIERVSAIATSGDAMARAVRRGEVQCIVKIEAGK